MLNNMVFNMRFHISFSKINLNCIKIYLKKLHNQYVLHYFREMKASLQLLKVNRHVLLKPYAMNCCLCLRTRVDSPVFEDFSAKHSSVSPLCCHLRFTCFTYHFSLHVVISFKTKILSYL